MLAERSCDICSDVASTWRSFAATRPSAVSLAAIPPGAPLNLTRLPTLVPATGAKRVCHPHGVYVPTSGVIGEGSAAPFAANESHAAITESVVHAAVESDVRSPVAGMKSVNAAGEAPVSGGPH